MGKETEALIQTILRSYTGVFTDYAYISEASLSIRTGLTREQIYNILVTLTKRRIVDYIPHKKTPYIIYTRERQELRFCTYSSLCLRRTESKIRSAHQGDGGICHFRKRMSEPDAAPLLRREKRT